MDEAAFKFRSRGGRTSERPHDPRNAARARGQLAVGGLAAGLAAVALAAPALAATKPALLAQAAAGMQQTNVKQEALHTIPFKTGTKFTINCGFEGQNILCTEHAGPERCSKGQPWLLLSDIFPVIKGRVGQSLTHGLLVTDHYCKT